MTTYIELGDGAGGGGGSAFYGDPVANFASLPLTGQTGEVRLTVDTGIIYYWDGSAWNVAETEVAVGAHADTDSITLTTPGSILTAALNLSSDAATASFLKATTTIKTGAGKGLHVEIPYADTSTIGVLTDTDWDTFNGKEPPISAGTTAQFWRGDKSFQSLDIDAMQVLATGTVNAGTNLLGANSAVSAISTTNVGATGVWSSSVDLSLAAGTWSITGLVHWGDNSAVLTNEQSFGISIATDATGIGDYDHIQVGAMQPGTGREYKHALPQVIVGSATPFHAFLNSKFSYTSGTPKHGGKLIATRIR